MECPICNSTELVPFLVLDNLPIQIGTFYPTAEKAQAAPKGSLSLTGCGRCGHVFNQAFDPERMKYETAYDNSLFFSEYFRTFARQVCKHLSLQYDLKGREILEIGSGYGDFLQLLCEMNDAWGTGYDPATPLNREFGPRIRMNRAYYASNQNHHSFDLICSRHVLEHLSQPAELVREIGETIQRTPNAIVYLEVPNFDYTLRETAIWDLIYEHCQYFTPSSLMWLMESSGFEAVDLYETFEGQYLAGEFKWAGTQASPHPQNLPWAERWRRFGQKANEKLSLWQEQINALHLSAAWGAGAKGVSFLNLIQCAETIPWIVDVNPRKQGAFIPGSSQQVIAPENLTKVPVQQVLLMNRIYLPEVQAKMDQLGLSLPVVPV